MEPDTFGLRFYVPKPLQGDALREEIERIIGNRHYEHGHPFKRGSAGMDEFYALVHHYLPTLDDDEFARTVTMMEALIPVVHGCLSCEGKLYGYLYLALAGRDDERATMYWNRAEECSTMRADYLGKGKSKRRRDYLAEVGAKKKEEDDE